MLTIKTFALCIDRYTSQSKYKIYSCLLAMVITEAILCGSCRAFAICSSCSMHGSLGLAAGWHVGQHIRIGIVGITTHLVVPTHILNNYSVSLQTHSR